MIWKKVTEKQIGGNYTWWDSENDSHTLLPLLYCVGNALPYQPLDYFLRGIFTDDPLAPGGGDPGWVWYREKQDDGTYRYYAWTYAEMSGLDPCEGDYDEATVKRLVRETLENFRKAHPDRAAEIDEVINKYDL
ncbi:hypothetical protein [Noviherbaspirillum humi]|uniref:hypothetical protein n=1 Tax=Noviherbaspirillum humi TaxID=1688639 RepID=UPI001C3C5B04|nr:hypothetical protein [Noviherbaspirillum humi]